MSKAKRRINSTGRKRIAQEHVDIRMVEAGANESLRARASIDLSGYNFPSDAIVSLEAYHRSSGMRFPCGTVASLRVPDILVLDEVDQTGSILFRVKVVEEDGDRGKILGSAERIHPSAEQDEKDRRSLFPVIYRKLGEQVWKVEISPGGRPHLILNTEIPGIKNRLKTDAFLQGLLFPAAFRTVLERLVSGVSDDDEDDDSERPAWQDEWLHFCSEGLGIHDAPPSDTDEREKWVEYTVEKFCSVYGFMKAIRKQEEDVNESAAS